MRVRLAPDSFCSRKTVQTAVRLTPHEPARCATPEIGFHRQIRYKSARSTRIAEYFRHERPWRCLRGCVIFSPRWDRNACVTQKPT